MSAADPTRRDVYAEVTAEIVAALEAGTVPWERPWTDTAGERNLSTGKAYRGVNQLLLGLTAAVHGYESPHWVTFKQAKALGGSVRKGEKSSMVTFWKRLKIEGEPHPISGDKETRIIPMLKYYRVFNSAQCDGLTIPEPEEAEPFEPLYAAQAIIDGYEGGPVLVHRGGQACYAPGSDRVQLPEPEHFPQRERYYSTAFHELAHSTGHENRLDRDMTGGFGSGSYSREELVAELSASFLCGVSGIAPAVIDQSAAYCASWAKALKDDGKLIVTAAAQAQRAADWIRGERYERGEKVQAKAAAKVAEAAYKVDHAREVQDAGIVREAQAARTRGFVTGSFPCDHCGRFKSRPSDRCDYCGTDPVQNAGDHCDARDRAEHDAAHGYAY